MSAVNYEAVVEHGQVRLPAESKPPENARVYMVVPEAVMDVQVAF
jgi:hypothetical protein